MPKLSNQKLKLYHITKILMENTDEEHHISAKTILSHLEVKGISCSRKTLYSDIEELRGIGVDVVGHRTNNGFFYYIRKRTFELAELKLLVDAVQSSKFITETKSKELIKKLTKFTSKYEKNQLTRQMVVKGRIKSMNESIYYNVDEIQNAISNNKQIRFEYLNWNLSKQMVLRKNNPYEVSPWALTWDNENYYMIAYDAAEDKIKHYRVDKMQNIVLKEEKREGKEHFKKCDIASYAKKTFSMFGGEEIKVKLRFRNDLVGVILDRFGKDITLHQADEEGWSETSVDVALSDQFFGFLFGLGTGVKIVSPEDVAQKYKEEAKAVEEMY
ncbi:MAG: transcriptional regulator [Lachnospiraceae bacterium]|nr:transcriptional regulator [Lachnospiraceae bacterium]